MYTLGGIRALRASILQPSCNKEFIENRLDAVQDLIDNEAGLMVDVQVFYISHRVYLPFVSYLRN